MAEHCVTVTFPFRGTDLKPVFELEDQLVDAIERNAAGEFDGNEVGGGQVALYMSGPDADVLYAAVAPILRDAAVATDGVVVRRYGPPDEGVRETRTPVR